jgi:hypothetical protein
MEPIQDEHLESPEDRNRHREHEHHNHQGHDAHHDRNEHEHHHHSGEHEHHPHHHDVEVKVNNKEVKFTEHQVTGAIIKSTAIAQGVPIQPDFQLFQIIHGQPLKQIGDNEQVNLHECEAFRATAPDDNSGGEWRDR